VTIAVAAAVFAVAAVASLTASWVLVTRLERVGERLRLSEALLGLVAALAADAPEITSAVAAMTSRQQRLGAGVIIGSNVFNLAALLGLGALVAGRIGLHRKAVVLGGAVAGWVAAVCVAVVAGLLSAGAGLALALGVTGLYAVLLGMIHNGPERLRLPSSWLAWLRSAVAEEEMELLEAIRPRPATRRDVAAAAGAVLAVVVASVAMERAAAALGTRLAVPQIVVGGLVLAAVTSLPNAVAAVYLAARGRGAATFSTALNSNTLNVAVGLLIPAAVVGLGRPGGPAVLAAAWYAGLTAATLAFVYTGRGLRRPAGALIVTAYLAFAAALLAPAAAPWLAAGTGLILAAGLAARVIPGHGRPRRTPGPAAGAGVIQPVPARPASLSNGHRPARSPARRPSWRGSAAERVLPGWPAGRLWALGVALMVVVAAVDAGLGHRVVLIGLLIVGPCSVLLTGRWVLTGLTGLLAIGLAVALGIPDGIWGTVTHLAFLAALTVVTMATTLAAALIGPSQP
jgi:cation:H+ antiporter